MKNKLSLLCISAGLVFAMQSCLKDSVTQPNSSVGSENATRVAYFTQSVPGVPMGLTQAVEPQSFKRVIVGVTGDVRPTAPVAVSIVSDPSAIPSSFTPLPAALFSFPASFTIPAGSWADTMTITVQTATLDPNIKYAIALKINSADQGYGVASNLRTVIIPISVKNRYDGRYLLSGYHNRVPYNFRYWDVEMDMITVDPVSVQFYFVEADDYGHPIGTGPNNAISWYGNTVAPVIRFDNTTNQVTSVFNASSAGPPITLFTGAGSYPSRYDPATKTIYVCWNYNANPLRAFFDTLVYEGPRP